MNKERFLELYKTWSSETAVYSTHQVHHPAYLELKSAGNEIVPWMLSRLQDTVGRDVGDKIDHDNSPWLSICLLHDIVGDECFKEFSYKHAGNLVKIRKHLLKWGKEKKFI